MPPCAVCQGVYGLVAPATRVRWSPDAPAAVGECTKSGVSAAGTPGGALLTTCPVPAAARCPAPARSPTNCSPPASGVGRWHERAYGAVLSCLRAAPTRRAVLVPSLPHEPGGYCESD